MDNLGLFAGSLNRILLVDPLQDNTARLETLLATHHVQLVLAENDEEALTLLSVIQPELILINESLPPQQFAALIHGLHAHAKACHIPIIVLAQHLRATQENLIDNHLDRLFTPLNPDVLIKMLHRYAQMFSARNVVSALHNHHDQLLETKNEGLLALNHLGQIVYANNAAARLLGFKPSVLLDLYIESLFEHQRTNLVSQWKNHPVAKICDEKNILQVEKAFFWGAAGTQLPVKFAAVPIFDEPLVSVVIAFQLRESTAQVLVDDQHADDDFSDVLGVEEALMQADKLFQKDSLLQKEPLPQDTVLPAAVSPNKVSAKANPRSHHAPIDNPQASAILSTELVLNDYLQKVYDSAEVHRADGVYLFQVNHWRHLLEGLGREIMPHVIKSIRQLMIEQLPETLAIDYLENGRFCLLSTEGSDLPRMIEVGRRLQGLVATPLVCLEHTLFLSVLVGGTALKQGGLLQVSLRLRQALILAQENSADGVSGDGVAVIAVEGMSHDDETMSSTLEASELVAAKNIVIERHLVEHNVLESFSHPSSALAALTPTYHNPLNQDWLRSQSPELQLRPFFDLQNNMIMGLNVSALFQHPTLGWQELGELCTYYRSCADFITIAQRLIELFMRRLALELRGENLPASCQICLKIPAALLGVADFYAEFIQSLSGAGIVGESIWIELPESAWRVSSPIFLANIKSLHLHGIGLVVSEFGQALAPLALLDKLPITAIKLASKITDNVDLYRDKPWLKTLKELAQSSHIKLWATQFTRQSRGMLVSQLGVTLTDGPSFEFSESGLSVAEFYALTQEVCLNTDVVE